MYLISDSNNYHFIATSKATVAIHTVKVGLYSNYKQLDEVELSTGQY